MRRRPRVLVTMFNRAHWSGLHENIWYAARGMTRRGWDVTVACRPGALVERLRADGIGVHEIADWDDWAGDAEQLAAQSWDLVHTHPFASRELGLAVSGGRVPVVSTFHGYNKDGVWNWAGQAAALVAVSPSHAELIAGLPGVDPAQVRVIRNGVRDELFAAPVVALDERRGRVVDASRLDADKHHLRECLAAVVSALNSIPGHEVVEVSILGSGTFSEELEGFLDTQRAVNPRVRFTLTGWVDSETVAEMIRTATVAIASGRGAAQALAVGTPVVAFGSQGVYGLQYGTNLEWGLWGNFGGHPLEGRAVTDIATDVSRLLTDAAFAHEVITHGRATAETFLRQSVVDEQLHEVYTRFALRSPRRGWFGRLSRRVRHR